MKLKYIVGVVIMMLSFKLSAQQTQPNMAQKLIGTWVSEDDTKLKLVIGNTTYSEYYDGELLETFGYMIGPQCGDETDFNAQFLKSTDASGQEFCYELYGADANGSGVLSMRYLGNGKIFVYNKQ
ncbi:hypothetical protein NBRC110019_25670 [Neptunitalea chrysea]|uniref:DUF2147 domain-containing protein n=1 Tax=Neptunitalea chrysea TaxID=1647581 RepID=A0A9W6EVY3_9FLAO|nr:hypothetical protein [Neptunitalea chrysea]GLB53526.1 hypothetical protein NBRC110019_25670 [Neptunitalea chrysea]